MWCDSRALSHGTSCALRLGLVWNFSTRISRNTLTFVCEMRCTVLLMITLSVTARQASSSCVSLLCSACDSIAKMELAVGASTLLCPLRTLPVASGSSPLAPPCCSCSTCSLSAKVAPASGAARALGALSLALPFFPISTAESIFTSVAFPPVFFSCSCSSAPLMSVTELFSTSVISFVTSPFTAYSTWSNFGFAREPLANTSESAPVNSAARKAVDLSFASSCGRRTMQLCFTGRREAASSSEAFHTSSCFFSTARICTAPASSCTSSWLVSPLPPFDRLVDLRRLGDLAATRAAWSWPFTARARGVEVHTKVAFGAVVSSSSSLPPTFHMLTKRSGSPPDDRKAFCDGSTQRLRTLVEWLASFATGLPLATSQTLVCEEPPVMSREPSLVRATLETPRLSALSLDRSFPSDRLHSSTNGLSAEHE
mmetsp:Transcript_7773/g.32733  ORF Transcript_7773/g.32733 Transcript_7773/m.32733 type:complete len:427 (-) Transcript_7773:259-1539(-)